jgi:hypothetical protein
MPNLVSAFTAVGAGPALGIVADSIVHVEVSGTFVGSVVIEHDASGGGWEPLATLSGAALVDVVMPVQGNARAAEALKGVQANTIWVWPGSALSASVSTQFFQFPRPAAAYVRWLLVWTPNGNAANGVRVVHADDGPTNLVTIAEFTGRTEATPVVDGLDVTATWNALIAGQVQKHIGLQLRGNPIVFRSTFEIVP